MAKAKDFLSQALPGFGNFLRDAESKSSHAQEAYSSGSYSDQFPSGGYETPTYGETGGNYAQQGSGTSQGADYGREYGPPSGRQSAGQREYYNHEPAGSGYGDT
jgi:hypothetical protein